MKKENILVFIGDWPSHAIDSLGLFNEIEKKFNCKIEKIDDFSYKTRINSKDIRFQFCFGPRDDKIWEARRKARETEENKMPKSIENLFKLGINADEIYYFGFCGILKGKADSVFIPTCYKEVLFKDYPLNAESLEKASLPKELKFKNAFSKKLDGFDCISMTSNHVLSLRYIKDSSEETLIGLSNSLAEMADIIEMEGYEILRLYKDKFKGSFYYGSDHPGIKGKMLGHSRSAIKIGEKFTSRCMKTLEIITS